MICCKAKYIIPAIIGVAVLLAFYVLDLMDEFHPIVSDTLPHYNHTGKELYAIIVPPANSGDAQAQRAPLQPLLELLDQSDDLFQATMAAAESFVNNDTMVSVASPIECSFQLYKVDEPPEQDDMWTARGILVQTTNFAETQQLTKELQGQIDVPLQAVRFGPGAFVHGNHPFTNSGAENIIFAVMMTYWVENLIALHWETFDYQDKFVVLRLDVLAKNAKDDIVERQYVIMKADSLDVYEQIYPDKTKQTQEYTSTQQQSSTKTRIISPDDAIAQEL